MRILLIHNHYQRRGGEDTVFEAEKEMLRNNGNEVFSYERFNDEIKQYSTFQKLYAPFNTIWSRDTNKALSGLVESVKPDIVHFHNFFPLISPSAYQVFERHDIPIVQTLHNFRLICCNGILFRKNRICEDCLKELVPWPGVIHACYRGSHVQSLAVFSMIFAHRIFRTWQEKVNRFITFTDFGSRKFIQGGLPSGKIEVKPHFVSPDPGVRNTEGNYAVFIGRLSSEKGVHTLINSWQNLGHIPLKIVGDGPMMAILQDKVSDFRANRVEFLGWLPRSQIFSIIKKASFLIFPSECYETFGISIIEAFACGVPVITSNIGAQAEIVQDGYNGMHFITKDEDDLAKKVAWAWEHRSILNEMGMNARNEYETKYTQNANYEKLINIYNLSLAK